MSNHVITTAISNFLTPARKIGLTLPDAIAAVLDPDAHPRAQLRKHLDGIPSIPEAVHAALNAGKNPHTDQGVADAIRARNIWGGAGDLDAVQEQRISAAFREHWEAIVDAVDSIYTPAARDLTDAHATLTAQGLDYSDTDGIRRAGGPALAAWAKALAAQEVYTLTPQIMTNARNAGYPGTSGNRALWTVTPSLDTWTREEPNTRDPWAVLASGATLTLARTRTEAEDRAQLVHRERTLANRAARDAATRGGYGMEPSNRITYTGADGQQRTTDMHGVIRTAVSTYRNAHGTEVAA